MKLIYKEVPFPHFLIEDFYSEEESADVKHELKLLVNSLQTPEFTSSARNPDGTLKKKNLGIFLSDVYKINNVSSIFNYRTKLFVLGREIMSKHLIFKYFSMTNYDDTIIQFYKNGDYYGSHCDIACYSFITVFLMGDKKYEGGKLKFQEFDYEVDLKHNNSILFPSCMQHEVTQIKTDSENTLDNRISITTLIGMNPFKSNELNAKV